MNLPIHHLCNLVPPSSPAEYQELLDDMQAHGYDPRFPIVIFDGAILDGRHRARAAAELGITPATIEWTPRGDDTPALFILRAQRRRNMTASQRAALAVQLLPELEKEAHKREKAGKADPTYKLYGRSRGEREATTIAAKEVGASAVYVKQAKKLKEVAPEKFEKVAAGTMTIAEATKKPVSRPPEIEYDEAGRVVKEQAVRDALAQRKMFEKWVNALHALKREILEVAETKIGQHLRAGGIETDFKNLTASIRWATPYTTCAFKSCLTQGCKTCNGERWMTKAQWDALPKELRGGH